eukprot:TRINITY_DN1037_c0_g1_i2.p1 TRINITY_DN1037_c0_g1~~TRINITY_DN1037_c0_g1_i2.p1  ORF type:complete len:425 (+),score=112.33 TRINITY_DN1037_c0_g1_i2:50-1324(+)
MDVLLQNIQLSTKKGDYGSLRKMIDESTEDVFGKHPEYVGVLLENLELDKYTAAWCHILSRACGGKVKSQTYMDQVEVFFAGMAADQVRGVCADRFGIVSKKYTEMCRETKSPGRGIPHLLHGIQKIRKTPADLTPLHPDYVCLCLLQKQYNQAKDLLERTILNVEPKQTGVLPVHMMLYYYYGGMVYIGLKDFKRATEMLETCLCAPSSCLTAITLEAFKKYVLCSLIETGKMPLNLPKHCPSQVVKVIRRYSQVYMDFAGLFKKKDSTQEELNEFLEAHKEGFKADKNYGLAKQAVVSHLRIVVGRVEAVFSALPLAELAKKLKMPVAETEKCLLTMIRNNVTTARIDRTTQMVHFTAPPLASYTREIIDELEKLKRLTETIKQENHNVKCSKEYIIKEMNKDPAMKEYFSSQKTKKRKPNT